ncbi:hypothetical protein DFP73DRAFT_540393 [Morchella snyderi]|nr:hypothetical protein DFP73DRAFT_540393 [Morchella snyderi]
MATLVALATLAVLATLAGRESDGCKKHVYTFHHPADRPSRFKQVYPNQHSVPIGSHFRSETLSLWLGFLITVAPRYLVIRYLESLAVSYGFAGQVLPSST